MPFLPAPHTMNPGSRLRELAARVQGRLQGEEGFTLVELTIVLLILGILLSIAVPSYLTLKDNASKTSAKADIALALRSVASYGADNYSGSQNDPDPGVSTSDTGYQNIQLTFLQAKYDQSISITPGAPYVLNPAGFSPLSPTDFCITATVGRWTAAQRGIDTPVALGIAFDGPTCAVH